MEETAEQLEIKRIWKEEDCNILLGAAPGSGKTWILFELLKLTTERTLFLSFNKSIQKESQTKIDELKIMHGKALTMHSLGFDALKKKYDKVTVVKGLGFELLKEVQKRNKKVFNMFSWENRMKLSYTLLDLYDASRIFYTTNLKDLKKHLLEQGKIPHDTKVLPELFQDFLDLRNSAYNKPSIEIDFTDMLFLPVLFDLEIPIYPINLYVDECQDFSLLQHTIVKKLISQGSIKRCVFVGDEFQSIYLFSGADSNSFNKFAEYPNTKRLPLSNCFRCPKNVINEVNKVYNVVNSPEWKEDGILPSEVNDFADIKAGNETMVICRNTAPLIDVFFYLLSVGKPCYIEGDDVIGGIKSFLGPYKSLPVWKAFEDIDNKISDTLLKDTRKEEVQKELYLLKDNRVLFKKLVDNFNAKNDTVKNLLFRLETLLKNNKGGIKLCTIHKSKGLEADYVYILNEDLIPSKFSTSPEQLKQEENLRYVARSRAKKELYYLNVEI